MPLPECSTATLRLVGDSLIPYEVSRLLGAQPTVAHTKGTIIVGKKTGHSWVQKTGTGRIEAADRKPADLTAQVGEILSQLTHDLAIWKELGQRFKIDLFCGVFMATGNDGFDISPQAMTELGVRGINLLFDIYDGERE